MTTEAPKQKRGFALLSPELRREIAGRGGRRVADLGTGHRWTHETAKVAAAKGGRNSRGGKGKLEPGVLVFAGQRRGRILSSSSKPGHYNVQFGQFVEELHADELLVRKEKK